MAKRNNLVAASSINVEKGLVKDVGLLHRFVDQETSERREVIELLERCIRTGSKKMREAAFPLLARADLPRAETLALEMADLGARAKKPKERAERFAFLTVVATTKCLDRADALGIAIGTLYADQLARAVDWLRRALERERERGTSVEWLRERAGMFTYVDAGEQNAARDWFASLIDAPGTRAEERAALIDGMIESHHLPVLRRKDLPDALVPKAAFALPTEECFERLAPHLDRMTAHEAIRAFADAHMMFHAADERWFDYWLGRFADATAREQVAVLETLEKAARVDDDAPIRARLEQAILERLATLPWEDRLDDRLRKASAWRYPAAVEVLMKGIAHAVETYGERGHRTLAFRLRSLHAHGRAEHIPQLETHARHIEQTDGSRAAAAWFSEAISAIRGRL